MIDCILVAIAVDADAAQQISVHETLIVSAWRVGTKMAFAQTGLVARPGGWSTGDRLFQR